MIPIPSFVWVSLWGLCVCMTGPQPPSVPGPTITFGLMVTDGVQHPRRYASLRVTDFGVYEVCLDGDCRTCEVRPWPPAFCLAFDFDNDERITLRDWAFGLRNVVAVGEGRILRVQP